MAKKKKGKKDKPLGLKAVQKEFTEEVLGDDRVSKIILAAHENFTDATHKNATHVIYVLKHNNLMEMWVRYQAPGSKEHAWKMELDKISPVRAAAEAHLDATKWRLFHDEGKTRRKKEPTNITPLDRERLRCAVRYFYDLQKLRIQAGNRDSDQADPAVLDHDDKDFLGQQSVGINALEKACLNEIESILDKSPIYNEWLKHQSGCGPTMAGVLISEIDIGNYRQEELKDKKRGFEARLKEENIPRIHHGLKEEIVEIDKRLANIKGCDTVSALWAYAGLAVDTETGRAVRRQKGVKSNWNPFLKAKVVFVLGGCLLKASPGTKPPTKWRKIYDGYKHRKGNELVKDCMLCKGTGVLQEDKEVGEVNPATMRITDSKVKIERAGDKCYNCDGKKHNVKWGRSDAHRHQAAVRYMVKIFLLELWLKWRELEGLPITEPYSEAKLGIKHGDHVGVPQQPRA